MSKNEDSSGLSGTIDDYQNKTEFPPFNTNWANADHDHGVGYHAPWEDAFSGFPEHSRRCALALGMTGPVHLRSVDASQFKSTGDRQRSQAFDKMYEGLKHLLQASIKTYSAEIYQVVADPASLYRVVGPTHPFLSGRDLEYVHSLRVVSTVFERDRVIPDIAKCLNRAGQTWVANNQDRDMLIDCGVSGLKVKVVPIPYFPDDPHLELAGRRRDPRPPCTFYHVGKWEPRKEQRNILGAFMMAFRPGEAKLMIKTSFSCPDLGTYPPPKECIRQWLCDPRVVENGWNESTFNKDIFVIQARLSAAQMLQLHRQGDVYVTLSRGEGFDMPAYDAKLAGNLMVYTPSGGPQDFASPLDIPVPMEKKVSCHPFYRWDKEAMYGDYDLHHAVESLLTAHHEFKNRMRWEADRPKTVEKNERLTKWYSIPDMESRFSAESVGRMMRSNLDEMSQ